MLYRYALTLSSAKYSLSFSLSNLPLSVLLGLRLMRLRLACLVAVATTALTRSSAAGPNTARPRLDTHMEAGTAGAAATDLTFSAVCESFCLSAILRAF